MSDNTTNDSGTANSSEPDLSDNNSAQANTPDRQFGDETLCLHAGQIPDQMTGSANLRQRLFTIE